MVEPIQGFFDGLAQRGYEPLLHSITGSCRWDIAGVGSWRVAAKQGVLTVSKDQADADCVAECSPEDFTRMAQGKQNPITTFMQGKMKVTGDVGLAQVFDRLFP